MGNDKEDVERRQHLIMKYKQNKKKETKESVVADRVGEGQGGQGKSEDDMKPIPDGLAFTFDIGFLIVFPSISSKSVHLS